MKEQHELVDCDNCVVLGVYSRNGRKSKTLSNGRVLHGAHIANKITRNTGMPAVVHLDFRVTLQEVQVTGDLPIMGYSSHN